MGTTLLENFQGGLPFISWAQDARWDVHPLLLLGFFYWWISRFQNLPRFPWIHHFSNGVSELQSITAAEQSVILCVRKLSLKWPGPDLPQYIAPLLLGLCHEEHNQDELLIPAICALACIDTLSGFHVHTSDTLSLLEDQVKQFGILAKVFWLWMNIWNHRLIDTH